MTPMDARDPNVAMLDLVAERLGEELLADAVFVGGAVAGLLVTDPAAPAIRPTEDVDLVFGAIALADHHEFEARLRARLRARHPRGRADLPLAHRIGHRRRDAGTGRCARLLEPLVSVGTRNRDTRVAGLRVSVEPD